MEAVDLDCLASEGHHSKLLAHWSVHSDFMVVNHWNKTVGLVKPIQKVKLPGAANAVITVRVDKAK
jgi:hypothetical protein